MNDAATARDFRVRRWLGVWLEAFGLSMKLLQRKQGPPVYGLAICNGSCVAWTAGSEFTIEHCSRKCCQLPSRWPAASADGPERVINTRQLFLSPPKMT